MRLRRECCYYRHERWETRRVTTTSKAAVPSCNNAALWVSHGSTRHPIMAGNCLEPRKSDESKLLSRRTDESSIAVLGWVCRASGKSLRAAMRWIEWSSLQPDNYDTPVFLYDPKVQRLLSIRCLWKALRLSLVVHTDRTGVSARMEGIPSALIDVTARCQTQRSPKYRQGHRQYCGNWDSNTQKLGFRTQEIARSYRSIFLFNLVQRQLCELRHWHTHSPKLSPSHQSLRSPYRSALSAPALAAPSSQKKKLLSCRMRLLQD